MTGYVFKTESINVIQATSIASLMQILIWITVISDLMKRNVLKQTTILIPLPTPTPTPTPTLKIK